MTSRDDIPDKAFQALNALYAQAEGEADGPRPECRMDGDCCRFAFSGIRLYASALERVHLVRESGPPPRAEQAGQCPYLSGSRCTARTGRTLGCRLYFCDPRNEEERNRRYERYHREIKRLHEKYGLEYDYRDIMELAHDPLGRDEPRIS